MKVLVLLLRSAWGCPGGPLLIITWGLLLVPVSWERRLGLLLACIHLSPPFHMQLFICLSNLRSLPADSQGRQAGGGGCRGKGEGLSRSSAPLLRQRGVPLTFSLGFLICKMGRLMN